MHFQSDRPVMRQFTMEIDDGLLHAATTHAFRTGRTVSDIVRELIAREVGWPGPEVVPPVGADARRALAAYSHGRRSSRRQRSSPKRSRTPAMRTRIILLDSGPLGSLLVAFLPAHYPQHPR